MHTLRFFFAIIFPKATQVCLSRSLKTLQNTVLTDYMHWVHVEKMHITLQFFGNVPQERVIFLTENVQDAIKNIPPFHLKFSHLEWFPTLRHPKILSLSVLPQADLARVSKVIGDTAVALNIPVETRPFRGHLTMGRLIRHRIPYELLETIKVQVIPPIVVNKIHLIESRAEKGRQNYYPLAEFKLAEI
ncbi:RNA 2',3'-cyclic phosphodiesterase [Legionella parisiensis]|uniref:RNA 2',3'-cyclic phosphodiesterase n=1 Tax=Legionella parisiensis TaxID=45071 RepID=A0A1E5JQD1_9GAMM|nr:RNA 2',3'-cyclic phosphodiesterase [Legionella parisiensis]KTD40245.1 RNA ligase/cyclic nucleotide phosphodiesterase [Legionella parisiensis]OEH46747.1 RNA 2',3'-cyclic phosphodiesterase [Legionella parisiensis]STX77643.1 RNA ligase/cyclic nucleotide phosphodiesterase [Legionella parisiensis]